MNSNPRTLIHPKFSIPLIPNTPLSKTLIHTAKTLKKPNVSFCTRNLFTLPILRCCSSSNLSSIDEDDDSPSARIFVKGFSPTLTEWYLAKSFSPFGEVSKVKIVTDSKLKRPLGFAFIWFTTEESAKLATNKMNGKFFAGRFISVASAKPEALTRIKRRKHYKF